MNQYLLKNFDNNTLNYNLDQFNWPAKVLEIIQEHYPSVTSLEHINKDVAPNDISKITGLVQTAFLSKELSTMLDAFAEEYVKPLIGNQSYLIKRQPTLNCVIPNQEASGRRLPFHQGIFYDNGRGQATIWMPLTETYQSNSMWIMDLEPSQRLTQQVVRERWSVEKFEQECEKLSRPVTLSPGQAHLFAQEHIHGNINNVTDITRFAIDWHVLIKGEECHRRLPGGFFRLPGDHTSDVTVDTDKEYICYMSNNSEFDKHIGKHSQRCTIEHYLDMHNIGHNGWQFENEYLYHLPIFSHLLEQNIDAIVVLSMYSIPDTLLERALELGVEVHFANELMIMRTQEDLDKILEYKSFYVPKKGLLSFE